MRARRIGRTLGIGVRVAARIATGRVAEPGLAPARPVTAHIEMPQAVPVGGAHQIRAGEASARATMQAGQTLGQTSEAVTRGVGGFLRPFRRAGGILWLEVTGVFFLLPVVIFAPALWREVAAYHRTTDHKTLWLTAGIVAVFLYLGISSFWRARRRSLQS